MSNAPIKRYRIGYVTATIWKNEKAGGDGAWFSVDIQRTYKDDAGELKNTNVLNHADLMNAARLLQKAEGWIADQ